MEIKGKVIVIGNTEVVGSAGTFKKRLIVVQSDEQYPQTIPVDFMQDKCDVLNAFAIGDDVTIDVNVRGNMYNDKYYVSLNGWKITKNANDILVNEPQHVADNEGVDVHF